MGSPVRIIVDGRTRIAEVASGWAGQPMTISRSTWLDLTVTARVHGVTVAGFGCENATLPDAGRRSLRKAVGALRLAAWRVLGERQPPDMVDLGDAWPFPAVSDAWQRGRRRWHRISERCAHELRDAVPPRYFRGWPGFMVGEPADHVTIEGREVAAHTAIVAIGGRWYARTLAAWPAALAEALAELRQHLQACQRCGHVCPEAEPCRRCGGDPLDLGAGDRLCARCDELEREADQLERADEVHGAAVGAAGEWLADLEKLQTPTG